MKSEDIFADLNAITSYDEIKKEDLMKILKKYSRIISPQDLMMATAVLREDGKYVQANYREKFLEMYVKYFIMRIKEILDNESDMSQNINKERFEDSLENLEHQFNKEKSVQKEDSKFPLRYTLVSLYTTFILEEPIHPVGSPFPGNLKVEEKDGKFYCPVKDAQMDNENAVCHFCLAQQTPKNE